MKANHLNDKWGWGECVKAYIDTRILINNVRQKSKNTMIVMIVNKKVNTIIDIASDYTIIQENCLKKQIGYRWQRLY